MKNPQPADYPVNQDIRFQPTKVYYHQNNGGFSVSLAIYDITDKVKVTDPVYLEDAKSLSSGVNPALEIRQESWHTRNYKAFGRAGAVVAEASGPLLDLGRWKIKFPAESVHSTHDLELRPTGPGRRQDVFVLESVPYFWDMVDPKGVYKLYKVDMGLRVEVANFTSKSHRDLEGVLIVNDKEVGGVVAIVTSIAVLKRDDSFRK